MTGRMDTFRNAVVSEIRRIIPGARSVESQFGRFDLDELERQTISAPAIRVAVLSGKLPPVASGQLEAALSCAAFVITEGKERDQAGWNLAEAVSTLLHTGQMWGLKKLGTPVNASITPVISGAIRQRAVSIIAVEWSQALRGLGENLFDEQGVLLEELYINGEEIALPEPEVSYGSP